MSKDTATRKQMEEKADELRDFVRQAKRRLLEFEVMTGLAEIKDNKTQLKRYQTAKDMVNDLD